MKKTRQEYIKKNLTHLQDLIIKNENFSIIKFGDGEIDCMQNKIGGNIDKHLYSKELGDKLKLSLIELVEKNVYISDWFYSNPPINSRDDGNLAYYEKFISENSLVLNFVRPFELVMLGWGNLELPYLFNFYNTIKMSKRHKIYVGSQKMIELKNILALDNFVEIPLINAFSEYNKIVNDIKNVIVDDSIIMLSVGLQSPVVSNELLNFNPNITIIDVGSGFDSLCFAQTRGRAQSSVSEAKKYFKEL